MVGTLDELWDMTEKFYNDITASDIEDNVDDTAAKFKEELSKWLDIRK